MVKAKLKRIKEVLISQKADDYHLLQEDSSAATTTTTVVDVSDDQTPVSFSTRLWTSVYRKTSKIIKSSKVSKPNRKAHYSLKAQGNSLIEAETSLNESDSRNRETVT